MKVFALNLLLVFSLSAAHADWIGLTKSPDYSASKQITKNFGSEIQLDVNVPGVFINQVKQNGKTYSKLELPESSLTLLKGFPELPKITSFIALPGTSGVNASIVNSDSVIREIDPLVPSKGNLMRDINPDRVEYEFSDIYQTDGWYPKTEEMVSVSAPFKFRDIWGVQLTVIPFQFNPKENKLRIYTKLTVSVNAGSDFKGVSRIRPDSADFENLYSDVFINYESQSAKGCSDPKENKNLLIIAHDSFLDSLKPLKEWKEKLGWKVDLLPVSQAGGSADGIKSFLQKRYDEGNLCFVLLVGDAEQVPTLKGKMEGADSDACYVKLAGNDNVPDAFISRISAETPDQVAYIAAKSINYEQNPATGDAAAWYKQALAIASDQGNPKDYERASELNASLKSSGFEKITECYDKNGAEADKNTIFNAVSEGCSIINYIGHGTPTQWVTSGFNVSDCQSLSNGGKLPVIWSVACLNGAFVDTTCFAEAWLRTGSKGSPAGCIGMAASTTNMAWVPPCTWQKHVITVETCQQKHATASVRNLYGVLKCMEQYGAGDKSEGNQLNEQLIYFGDGTVTLRNGSSRNVSFDKTVKAAGFDLGFRGTDFSGITVTVYGDSLEKLKILHPDENGMVSLALEGQKYFTVSGPDIIPQVDQPIN
ncbi:MAG: C25 family cysteine peptidase [Candidatus Wallbacteria bacterium]|nr:C25 family cysteine peptidase [Candidatus Wallbacteria bacterium]